MAVNNYASDSKNPFFAVEDVTDDEFLKHPRHGTSGYIFPEHRSRPSNPLEDRRHQLQEERRKIEERTLNSSHRSVGLLQESERAGIETAEELMRQREQLTNTEKRLDDINATLNTSQRHINNIKSVFSSLKSYFGSRGGPAAEAGRSDPVLPQSASESQLQQTVRRSEQAAADRPPQPHPGLRVRGLEDGPDAVGGTAAAADPYASVDARLDSNLEEMCSGLGRLRGLAEGLGQEISEQNEMLDRISAKTDRADIRVGSQNKEMMRIMKK